MKIFVFIDGFKTEVAVAGDDSIEDVAKDLSSKLSMANSIYLRLKDGNYFVIPEKAFSRIHFKVEAG